MNQQHKTVTHARSTNDLAQGIGAVRTVALLGLRLQLCSPASDEYELLLLLLLLLLRPPPPPPSPRASVSLRLGVCQWWPPGPRPLGRGPHTAEGEKKKLMRLGLQLLALALLLAAAQAHTMPLSRLILIQVLVREVSGSRG